MGNQRRQSKKKRGKSDAAPVSSGPSAVNGIPRRLRIGLMIGLGLVLLIVIGLALFRPRPSIVTTPTTDDDPGVAFHSPHPDFAGSESCATCHQAIYDQWKQSTHGRAGGRPGEVQLLAHFDGKPLRFRDAIVTPTTNALGRPVFSVQMLGDDPFEIEVDAVVGGGHMQGGGTQSFFEEFPDGTVRFLPFDFIREENLWFVQLRRDQTWVPVREDISLRQDLANWPPHRVLGSSVQFSNCQNCHGSQITLTYNQTERRQTTRFTSLAINCESCHGPGRRHVELAGQPGFTNQVDIGMKALATLSKDESLQVCFQCHATKDLIRDEPFLPGDPLEDFFSLKLPYLSSNPFLVDGRVARFGYQLNHLYSDCYLNGSMTCVDCHDPHGQHYRDVVGRPLVGKFDDGQCTACHASKALDGTRHTHHAADSPGSRCVACHMPYLQHQGVGDRLAFARSDHTISIPRPSFDQSLGIENACQKCHGDQSVAWQDAKVREWYGEIKPHHPLVANLQRARAVTDRREAATLLLDPDSRHVMAQTDGLVEFMKRFLQPNDVLNPEAVERLKRMAQSEDLDVQSLAFMALHIAYGRDPAVQSFLAQASSLLGSREETVRNRWAIAADHWGSRLMSEGNPAGALFCFQKSAEINPGSFVTLSHLAMAYFQAGDVSQALAAQRQAIAVKPYQAVLHFQLAQMLARLERDAEAIAALEKGLSFAPEDQNARRMLEALQSR